MNIAGGLIAVAIAVGVMVLIVVYCALITKWPMTTFLSSFLIFFLAMIFMIGATP